MLAQVVKAMPEEAKIFHTAEALGSPNCNGHCVEQQ